MLHSRNTALPAMAFAGSNMPHVRADLSCASLERLFFPKISCGRCADGSEAERPGRVPHQHDVRGRLAGADPQQRVRAVPAGPRADDVAHVRGAAGRDHTHRHLVERAPMALRSGPCLHLMPLPGWLRGFRSSRVWVTAWLQLCAAVCLSTGPQFRVDMSRVQARASSTETARHSVLMY